MKFVYSVKFLTRKIHCHFPENYSAILKTIYFRHTLNSSITKNSTYSWIVRRDVTVWRRLHSGCINRIGIEYVNLGKRILGEKIFVYTIFFCFGETMCSPKTVCSKENYNDKTNERSLYFRIVKLHLERSSKITSS